MSPKPDPVAVLQQQAQAFQQQVAAYQQQAKELGAQALVKGTDAASNTVEEGLRAARAGIYFTSHALETMLPLFTSLSEMREDVTRSVLDVVAGRKTLPGHLSELGERISAASRYEGLVHTLGRELFGSATFPGEQVLADNGVYRLVHLPARNAAPPADTKPAETKPAKKAAKGGRKAAQPETPQQEQPAAPPAIFFLGGFIPYGDRLFRFLPEANLYDRYLERGISVYAMELADDGDRIKNRGEMTTERQFAMIDELAEIAFRHNGERKLIAQGYCGSGMQLLAYLAARPEEADRRFRVASLFVTPVDAKRCTIFAETVANMPRSAFATAFMGSQVNGGYLRGLELWAGLDLSLKNVFVKTSVGRFATGWKQPAWAKVAAVSDLTPAQRFELAAAYWISVHNAQRFPLPADLVRKAVHLYDRGIGPDGLLGFESRGQPVGLKAIAERTSLRVVAFFGGLDKLVQEETGCVLQGILRDRYTQVTHPSAGHVSYVCFPAQWNAGHPKPFAPNPVDVMLAEYDKARA